MQLSKVLDAIQNADYDNQQLAHIAVEVLSRGSEEGSSFWQALRISIENSPSGDRADIVSWFEELSASIIT